ncbi:klc-2, partial [Symbiodinium microadriaticum]
DISNCLTVVLVPVHSCSQLFHVMVDDSSVVGLLYIMYVYSESSRLPAEAEDAVSQARKCLSDVEAQFGYSSKQAIHAATELALQLEELRPATAEAGELLQRALEGSKQAYGDQHLNTLRTANNLAVYLDNIGQKDEALQLYRWARDGRLKQLGATHPYTLDSMYNLASFLFYNGQMADAKEEFIRARDGCVECFGWTHTGTLDCTERLVDIYEAEGDMEEAEVHCRELLRRCEDTHPKDHSQTLRALVTLASLLAALGRLPEAEDVHRQAMQRYEAALGYDHAKTLELTYSLVEYLTQNQRTEEAAEALLRQKLTHCEELFGETSAVAQGYQEDLAILLENAGQVSESEVFFRRVLECERLGRSTRSASNLAVLLDKENRGEEALELHRMVHRGRTKVWGSETMFGGGAGLMKEAFKMQALGSTHSKTLESCLSLGVCLAENGHVEE